LELWAEVLKKISGKISRPSFETWFANTTAEINDDVMIVKAGNLFQTDWLNERYKNLIMETVEELMGRTFEIEISSVDGKSVREPLKFQNRHEKKPVDELKDLINEQNVLIRKQQEKIEELEARINNLEKIVILP